MDERIWTIAEILDKSGPMTADELAAQLKLSGKTVRSLIKTYAKEMQENGFCITAKPGRGFGIEITDAQTYVSGSKPQQGEQTGIPQDAQERIQRLRQYLLEKDGYSKLDDLSEQFFVSRRSISNDLREVERQLAEYGLSIRRKPGYGICVVGSETNRRICIAAQRDESRPVEQQIQELVSRVLEKEKFAMSTMALDNLAVHLEVAVERIRTGHAIESSDGMQADLPERILEVASHIAVQIENMTGVAFPLPEVCYIAMHLNGKQMYRANAMTSDENLVIPQEVNHIVSDMIEHIYEAFRIDFRDNLELRMGLCMHMVPLLVSTQAPFFLLPDGVLSPMTRRTLAESLGLNPSTITRALKGKYLQCRRGIYPLSAFFSQSVGGSSPQEIRTRMVQLLQQKPMLNDRLLRERLAQEGYQLAQRTVSKYRRQLALPAASKRPKK